MPTPHNHDPAIGILNASQEATGVLAALHGACLSPAWSEAMIASLLATPGGRAWIALKDDRPVGFSMIRQAADEAELLAIGVLATDRGRGIGRALLTATIEECTRAGLAHMYLEVARSNSAARKTYCSSGFFIVGHRQGYYRSAEKKEDAIVMRRNLM